MRPGCATLLLACALLAQAGCGSDLPAPLVADPERAISAPAPPADGPWFASGEKLAIAVSLRGIPAGELETTVGPLCRVGEHEALLVRAAGRSTGLVATFRDVWVNAQSLIDRHSGLALQVRTHKKVRRARLTEVELGDGRFWWRRKRPGKPPSTGERQLPPSTYDPMSLLGLLRSWRPAVNPEASVYVLVERIIWRVQLMYRGVELLDLAGGERPAVRVDGVAQKLTQDLQPTRAEPRAFSVWIGDDPDRVPLRFVIETRHGELLAELADYEPGQRSARAGRQRAQSPAGAAGVCPAVASVREAALREAAEQARRREESGERDRPAAEIKPFAR